MFDILDLFSVKENVSPNLQLWVDALNHYDHKAIDFIAEDVWIIARTTAKPPPLGSITQNVLLGALKFAITKHTINNADVTVDKELLTLSLRENIRFTPYCDATTLFYINNESVAKLDDIQRCVEALVRGT